MPESIINYGENNIWRKKYSGKDFKPLYDALSNVKAQCKKGGCKFQ
jgi:hypothetical protein